MTQPYVTELRLDAFKSHRGQRLAVHPVTLLVGRNGSGKSNVLDALSLFALLAGERDVNDLERGDKDVAGLRGGLSGAAPFGSATVKVGCTIQTSEGLVALDIVLDSESPEVISESAVLYRKASSSIPLISATRQSPGSGISDVGVYSRGAPKVFHMLSSRLCIVQAVTKVPQDTEARTLVVKCCAEVVAALSGIFVLDPVPSAMRSYARIGSSMTRDAASMSAVMWRLWSDETVRPRLLRLIQSLVEARVQTVEFVESKMPGGRLVDVMVALREMTGNSGHTVQAQLMSDGTLRYLSIITALLDEEIETSKAERTLVVEEIENGLFPSQAEQVLDLLREESVKTGTRLIATTHSPALLDALRPEDHAGVVVCDRSAKDGWSLLRPLIDHPRYVEIAGSGHVGQAVTRGLLGQLTLTPRSLAELLA